MFLFFLLTLTLIYESSCLTVVSEACARWATDWYNNTCPMDKRVRTTRFLWIHVSELHVSYGYTCQIYTCPMDTRVRITRVLWIHVSELHALCYRCQQPEFPPGSGRALYLPHCVSGTSYNYCDAVCTGQQVTVKEIFHNYQENICCRWTPWTAAVVRAARPSVGWYSSQFALKIRSLSTPISARLNVLE